MPEGIKAQLQKLHVKERILNELQSLRRSPQRMIFSAMIFALMAVLTTFSWDGIPKRLIICMGLTLLSGILILLPKLPNLISIPLLAVYLFYVPLKIFQRMELPVHDMSIIMDGAAELTAAFIICVYLLIFLFTQHVGAACGGGSAFFLILFLVEYYIRQFRGDFLMPSDLGATGTALTIMGSYNYKLSPEAIYTVIYFLFFIALGSKIRIRMHKRIHIVVSVLAVLAIGSWYYIVMDMPKPLGKEFIINYWNMPDTQMLNGASLSYFLLLKEKKIDIPSGYSDKALDAIAKTAEAEYKPPLGKMTQKPNIIMVMNEAWSDLRVLGELETSQAYMPFIDGLTENFLRGDLYVGILGGLTANTEFEALTGNSLSFLAPAAIPYQNHVQHDMPSLAKVLEEQGYETLSMHPSGTAGWNRGKVYNYLGFEEYIHQGLFQAPFDYVRAYISDQCNYQEIIYRYENRNPNAPFFLFDVTIQNHGGYGGEPSDVEVLKMGATTAESIGDLSDAQNYLSLMKLSDEALKNLVSYFSGVEEPVVFCIFGDHQPLLRDNLYQAFFTGQNLSDREQNLRKYIVPYVIWANYDVDWKEYGAMSANYLPAALLECAGLELPPFYQFLIGLKEEYPVLTKKGCLDKNGNLLDITDIWETEQIRSYRMLEYNQLYVKNYRKDIFEETRAAVQ